MAAQSARRVGYEVTTIDLFSDWDTQQIAESKRISHLKDSNDFLAQFATSSEPCFSNILLTGGMENNPIENEQLKNIVRSAPTSITANNLRRAGVCLLYTSPSPRDLSTSRMPSSA